VHPVLVLTAVFVIGSAFAYVHSAGRIWMLARVAR
jgi:hypothetical protein